MKRWVALLLCVLLMCEMPITISGKDMASGIPVCQGTEPIDKVSLSKYDKALVTAATDGVQWQIAIGNLWVDIWGETGSSLELNYGMLANGLQDNQAKIRYCTAEGIYSEEITVVLEESLAAAVSESLAPAAVSEASAAASEETVPAAVGEESAAAVSEPQKSQTYTVVVNYLFDNNEIAAEPYTATLAAESAFDAELTFPTVQGYLPYLNEVQQNGMTLHYDAIQQDDTYYVFYRPTEVSYTVHHYKQNAGDDAYTEAEWETKQAVTNSVVPESAKEYAGFYALLYEKPKVAADGSTSVEIYYDCYYYLMNFDLGGGYGTEPVYARYGAALGTIAEPVRAGYTFMGWSESEGGALTELPTSMPAQNSTYHAVWQVAETANVTVVFWGENANDEGYSYIKSKQVSAKPEKQYEYVHNKSDMSSKLWKFISAESVTVAADGSSVVNVYYDRTEKTLTFHYKYEEAEDKWEGQYTKTETITAKWGQNISKKYTAISQNAGGTFWTVKYSGSGPYTNYFGVMPEENAVYYYRNDSGSEGSMLYYGEDLEGKYTVKLFETEKVGGYYVTVEDHYDFEGFTYHEGTAVNSPCEGARFYYKRNSYSLTFHDGYEKVKSERVKYEAPLKTYKDYVPPTPDALEAGSVFFDGWYLNPECTGAEYKLAEHKMPAKNILLYAKWSPVAHTVTFYKDYSAWETGEVLETHPQATVLHGSKLEPLPENPINGSYEFVGWFYREGSEEKAIDFANMPIRKDLQVYARWSSHVLKEYIIYYKSLEKGNTLAEPLMGSALAGMTKTFAAKGGEELYAEYQEGYFPLVPSHSLTLDIEEEENNTFTFWYVQKEAVPYIVRYVDTDDKVLAEQKVVADNRKAVVTENFKPISGYLPDAYQKRLVVTGGELQEGEGYITVTVDGKQLLVHPYNVLTFVYEKDNIHAPYKITHYTQNADGKTWTPYVSTQAVGIIGKPYKATAISIPGFVFAPETEGTVQEGVLSENGLELRLYYVREKASLTIQKNVEAEIGSDISEDIFWFDVFDAQGKWVTTVTAKAGESVTIDGMTIGAAYTVKERTAWSWRYDAKQNTVAITIKSGENKITFTNVLKRTGWLSALCDVLNIFEKNKEE